ncbi:MAG: Vps62-related protein [Porticoccaceae bacterium]|nr:Vps62-related protein [Porticoccaceae bacterium]
MTNDKKLDLLKKYAPYVWLSDRKKSNYFPSSVDFAFSNMERFKDDKDGKYWIKTKDILKEPSDELPFFDGQNPAKAEVPIYAFWVDRHSVVKLVYFLFYPYNRGKSVINTIVGNHVGDWELVAIDLLPDKSAHDDYRPAQVFLSQHDGGALYEWGSPDMEWEGHRPIVYAAYGSHANYASCGEHKYLDFIIGDLTDWCYKDVKWNTQNNLLCYDFSAKKALTPDQKWPAWMRNDYSSTLSGRDPSDPTSGAIWRWGNPEDGKVWPTDYYRLESGPTGPISKDIWDSNNQNQEAILFTKSDFGGKIDRITSPKKEFSSDFNDEIRSINIIAGNWIIYKNHNFGGDSVFRKPGKYLNNDEIGISEISSVRVLPAYLFQGQPIILLFKNDRFGGDYKIYGADVPNLKSSDFNDTASSAIVISGTWKLYIKKDYGGDYSKTLKPGSYSSPSQLAILNDVVSSLKLIT